MNEPHFYTEQELRDLKLRKTTKPLKKTIEITARGAQAFGRAVLSGLERLGGKPKPKKRRIRVVPPEKPSLEVRISIAKAQRERRNRHYY